MFIERGYNQRRTMQATQGGAFLLNLRACLGYTFCEHREHAVGFF